MADGLDGVLAAVRIRTMIAIAEAGSFNRAAPALGVACAMLKTGSSFDPKLTAKTA